MRICHTKSLQTASSRLHSDALRDCYHLHNFKNVKNTCREVLITHTGYQKIKESIL